MLKHERTLSLSTVIRAGIRHCADPLPAAPPRPARRTGVRRRKLAASARGTTRPAAPAQPAGYRNGSQAESPAARSPSPAAGLHLHLPVVLLAEPEADGEPVRDEVRVKMEEGEHRNRHLQVSPYRQTLLVVHFRIFSCAAIL